MSQAIHSFIHEYYRFVKLVLAIEGCISGEPSIDLLASRYTAMPAGFLLIS